MPRALVTGGNRGIGREICRRLADEGMRVLLGSRSLEDGKAAAAAIGRDCEAVAIDLADPASIDHCLRMLDGEVDVLVNNAGVLYERRFERHFEDFEEALAVMLRGPARLIHGCLPHMTSAGFGRIVNVSSDWGSFSEGLGGPVSYATAKAALNALTRTLSRELPAGIKINAMCPGWVRTRMGGSGAERTVEEGADTAVWLATLDEDGPTGGFFRDRREIGW